jgi:hypothetical protein
MGGFERSRPRQRFVDQLLRQHSIAQLARQRFVVQLRSETTERFAAERLADLNRDRANDVNGRGTPVPVKESTHV